MWEREEEGWAGGHGGLLSAMFGADIETVEKGGGGR